MSKSTSMDERRPLLSDAVPQNGTFQDDPEDDEELVEEEVTDDEEAQGSEVTSDPVNVESPAASRTTETPTQKAPGKVTPSEKVKNMDMKSPDSKKTPQVKQTLSPDKNPFPVFGDWTPSTLSQIEIAFPILTSKNETTNELTRTTRPEARYWKAPILFKYGNYTSETLRFNNAHIPFHTGKGYGSNYVYLCLPGFVGDAFAEAGKKRAPTRVLENSLVADSERWWKIANNVEGTFGIINQNTKRFHTKSLETILDSTNAGLSCSVVLSFKCKASTTDTEPLKATTVRTVQVEIVRAYITATDINVQMPTRITKEKPKSEPTASAIDVASDDLMKRLADLGL